MARKLSRDQKREREVYSNRVRKTKSLHQYGFDALSLAKKGKLSRSQKAAITRQWKQQKQYRILESRQRVVFVPVKSKYRKTKAIQTGTVVDATNKGVIVSVNTGQIERTGLGKVKVSVGKGGVVSIRYGKTKVDTVAVNKISFARNPARMIQTELRRRKARSVSVVINGYESRGASTAEMALSQAWMQYTNDLIDKIANDMLKADKRRTRKSVRDHLSEHISFRFYYGTGATPETISEEEFRTRYAPEEGDDFDDLSDE